ncbi:unnamed protein product [Phytomonas sp. Hart1]|nr:unnamed protein product [Phytomonas sp. Hart1]|eukprot:CCW69604.1 unnamed protein product [Phytomonas sp. isolate Hart1]
MHRLETSVRNYLQRTSFPNHSVGLSYFNTCSSPSKTVCRYGGLRRVLFPCLHLNHRTQNGVKREGSTEVPGSSSPFLSPFSTRVRELLLKFPKVSNSERYRDCFHYSVGNRRREMLIREGQAAEEDLLMWLAVTPCTSPTSALHPLLCLRVLERLGYAVYRKPAAVEGDLLNLSDQTTSSATSSIGRPSHYSDSSLFSEDALRAGGWLSRHVHLSLLTSPLQLRNIADNVLTPLEALIGDPSRNSKSHPQVAPVLDIALEWWCTLPSSSRLPTDSWMPRLASFYNSWKVKFRQLDEGRADDSRVDTKPPPITFLLPYFVEKVREIELHEVCPSHSDRNSDNNLPKIKGNVRVSTENRVRKALVQLFALFLSASSPANLKNGVEQHFTEGENTALNREGSQMSKTCSQESQPMLSKQEIFSFACTISCDEHEFTLPSITLRDSLLVNVLFWQGTSPLLALPLVADSLYRAAVLVSSFYESCRSSVRNMTNDTFFVEEKEELLQGRSAKEDARVQNSCSNLFTSSKQRLDNGLMTFQIPIHDDDTLRKLLLRLSSVVAEPTKSPSIITARGSEDSCEDGPATCHIVRLIEPVVPFGTNLVGPHMRNSTVGVSSRVSRDIHGHDPFSYTAHASTRLPNMTEAEGDMPLRWVNPLHDYLVATYTEQAPHLTPYCNRMGLNSDRPQPQQALRLSFVGVVNVLTAVLECFARSRNKSGCAAAAHRNFHSSYQSANASDVDAHSDNKRWLEYTELGHITSDSFTLLPEKQRVHALKEICELLLNHARKSLRREQPPQRCTTECSKTPGIDHSTEEKKDNIEEWFPDVPVAKQEAILRRMCGACRALVRVVMEEKRCSLILEGPEGAAVNAGGASYSLPPESDTSTGVLFSGNNPQEHSKRFAEVLRNTAFRILEPSLWRYYTVCKKFEPQHLSFTTLQLICHGLISASQTLRKEMNARRTKTFVSLTLKLLAPGIRTADQAYLSTVVNINESWEHELSSFCESMESVYNNIGGAAAWKTALHILRNPLQQPLHAVIEGIRLVCLHILLFHNSGETNRINFNSSGRISAIEKGNACHDKNVKKKCHDRCIDEHVLLDVVQAFFCVWKHYDAETENGNLISAADVLRSPTTVVKNVSQSSDMTSSPMLSRLLLLVYLTLQRYFLRNGNGSTAYGLQYDLDLSHDPIYTAFRSLKALFPHQNFTAPPDPSSVTSFDVVNPTRGPDATGEVRAPPHLPQFRFPHLVYDLNSDKLTSWELAEKLREVVAETSLLQTGKVSTWFWVGTPAAVRCAMRALRELSTSPEEAGETFYFLLPWSAWAISHHPLRLYDESGQSMRAAEVFEQELQSFLESSSDVLNHDVVRGEAPPGVRVVMRFVSAMEEIQHFSFFSEIGKCTKPVKFLADDIQVVNAEAALEEGMQAWLQDFAVERSGVDSVEVQNEEDEYDGLD